MPLYVQLRKDASEQWRTIGIFGRRKDAELFADAVVRYMEELAEKTGDRTLTRCSRVVPADEVRRPAPRALRSGRVQLRAVS